MASDPQKVTELKNQLLGELIPFSPYRESFDFWVRNLLSVVCVGLAIVIFKIRPDISTMLSKPGFLFTLIGILILIVLSIWTSLLSGVPGREPVVARRVVAIGATLSASLFIAYLVLFFFHPSLFVWEVSWRCVAIVLSVSLIPFGVSFIQLKRLAVTHPRLSAISTVFSSLLTGFLAITLICPSPNPLRILVWHILPVVGVVALAALVGRRVFHW